MNTKSDIIETCDCGKEFTLDDIVERVHKCNKKWPEHPLYQYSCDCGSSKNIRVEIVELTEDFKDITNADKLNFIKTSETILKNLNELGNIIKKKLGDIQ